MLNKTVFFICGLVSIVAGIEMIHNPNQVYYSRIYGMTMDYTEYRIPFGLLLIITGTLFIWSILRQLLKKK